MNTQLLIDALVRQTTILIAQLATAGGSRTPISDVANQVFSDLARELHRQGVSRKVAADMFGMALRTYRRKVQRLAESQTLAGRSLWEAVHEYVSERSVVTRAEVLGHFHRDEASMVGGVLRDLVESGLVFRAGHGTASSYRAASRADLEHVADGDRDTDGTDTLVCAVIYRTGPLERARLGAVVNLPATALDASLDRLLEAGRVVRVESDGGRHYRADAFVIPMGSSLGWEAAVFDHFQAVVTTICAKLQAQGSAAGLGDRVGGSTYTLEVWPGHPLEGEAVEELADFRRRMGDLRRRIADYNRERHLPNRRSRVVIYGGQCVTEYEELPDDDLA